jgi:molybdate-binding protein/DNA-binding XRE family transcriptional regulator
LKKYRRNKGLSQEELASLVNVRRQAIYDMESGKYLPNTAVALRLARVLGCTVEILFAEERPAAQGALRLLGDASSPFSRLALAKVRETLVGIPLDEDRGLSFELRSSDGTVSGDRQGITLLPGADPEKNILILGCDPALSLLREHTSRFAAGLRAHAMFASSGRALRVLSEGASHVAGIHFHSDGNDDANMAAVRAYLPGVPCILVAFSRQEEGLMVAAGNPLGIRGVEDLARPDLRFAGREQGAALRALLDALLTRQNIPSDMVHGRLREVRSHCEGAFHVACNAADAATGLRVIAKSFGLDFIPLAVTSYDLAIPKDITAHPGVDALLNVLQSGELRRELQSLPGYDVSETGAVS